MNRHFYKPVLVLLSLAPPLPHTTFNSSHGLLQPKCDGSVKESILLGLDLA